MAAVCRLSGCARRATIRRRMLTACAYTQLRNNTLAIIFDFQQPHATGRLPLPFGF